ncbi:MAG TPA: MBL fold metallo-hydrolase [Bacteroidales bacterium]|nr:MBL fold metallo-hydrolase [Bacteroidales bacterium]
MRITFLGTGTSQGVPVIACNCLTCQSKDSKDKRLRSSLLIETGERNIVIDAGPDFRQQMLRAGVKKLDSILLTHEHKDHIGGMDDVRAFNYISKKPIDIYSDERVQQAVKREYPYVFSENKYPGVPQMNLINIDEDPFRIGNIKILPVKVHHYRLPVYGFRINDFAYITDANYISEENKKKLIGVKYLVINALRKEKHLSHFNLREAIELINEVSPRKGYITHISHQMGLHSEISKELPASVELAYDELAIDI